MDQYYATMWLEFSPADSSEFLEALKKFNNDVWPPLPNDWSAMLVQTQPNQEDEVRAALNTEFVDRLQHVSPYPTIPNNLRDPFIASDWYMGTGGLHEVNRIAVEYGVSSPYAKFQVGYDFSGQTHQMNIYVRARFVKIQKSV